MNTAHTGRRLRANFAPPPPTPSVDPRDIYYAQPAGQIQEYNFTFSNFTPTTVETVGQPSSVTLDWTSDFLTLNMSDEEPGTGDFVIRFKDAGLRALLVGVHLDTQPAPPTSWTILNDSSAGDPAVAVAGDASSLSQGTLVIVGTGDDEEQKEVDHTTYIPNAEATIVYFTTTLSNAHFAGELIRIV